MAFTDPFIRRPVLATVVSLLIVLLGFQAWSKLPLRQYPQMENALITVTTAYPGANAETIQGYITQPMQQSLASAEGSTSKKACRRACAEGASAPSPSGVRRSVSNSDEITFEHNPLVKRMFAWTRRRKARPHSPHRVCQKVTAT